MLLMLLIVVLFFFKHISVECQIFRRFLTFFTSRLPTVLLSESWIFLNVTEAKSYTRSSNSECRKIKLASLLLVCSRGHRLQALVIEVKWLKIASLLLSQPIDRTELWNWTLRYVFLNSLKITIVVVWVFWYLIVIFFNVSSRVLLAEVHLRAPLAI